MRRAILLVGVLAALVVPLDSMAASATTKHCGSLTRAHDGPPGPADITAKNVSCKFARHWAYLLRCPPGWKASGFGGGIGHTRCSNGNKVITRQNV